MDMRTLGQQHSSVFQQPQYRLNFKVVYCTGEDPEFPVSELGSQGSSKMVKGWQSTKLCHYPQELILQFSNIVNLKQIQFLVHQSKISQRLELYTFLPSGQQAMASQILLNQIKFSKLGFLNLNSNEASNFEARELKSVYTDCTTLLLKIVFRDPFPNHVNVYNQVGLVAINCLGSMLVPDLLDLQKMDLGHPARPKTALNPHIYQNLAHQTSVAHAPAINSNTKAQQNPGTEMLNQLIRSKRDAVQKEDYDEAKFLKQKIDQLHMFQDQLNKLEARKQKAVHADNFDEAKSIKMQMMEINRRMLTEGTRQHHQQSYIDTTHFHSFEEHKVPTKEMSGIQWASKHESVAQDKYQSNKSFEQEDSVHSLPPLNDSHYKSMVSSHVSHVSVQRPASSGYDDQVIPTLKKKITQQQESEFPDSNEERSDDNEVIKLTAEQLIQAEPLMQVFGEDTVKKTYAKKWSLKEQGLMECEAILIDLKTFSKDTFKATAQIALRAIGDKVFQVNQKGLSLLETCLSEHSEQEVPIGLVNQISTLLCTKTADSNVRMRQRAEELLLEMAAHKQIGPTSLVQILTKKSPQADVINAKPAQMLGKMTLLNKILERFPDFIKTNESMLLVCLRFSVEGFQHSSNEVRSQSYYVILQCYKVLGKSIKSHLTGLRQTQLEMLDKGFIQIDVASGSNPVGRARGASALKKADANKAAPEPMTEFENHCQFCNLKNQAFASASTEELDLHYFKECPLLTECHACSKIVEIWSFTHHLLSECEKRTDYKECPKCKEAIHVDEFEKHEAAKLYCKPAPASKTGNRCPLCHEDCKAGQEGWREHLARVGCPSNPRKKLKN